MAVADRVPGDSDGVVASLRGELEAFMEGIERVAVNEGYELAGRHGCGFS